MCQVLGRHAAIPGRVRYIMEGPKGFLEFKLSSSCEGRNLERKELVALPLRNREHVYDDTAQQWWQL